MSPFRELVEACEDVRAASDECDIGEGLAHAVPFHLWNEFLSKLDAAQHVIDASPKVAAPALQVPAGWALVRTEPTAAMLDAGIEEIDYDGNEVADNVRNVWLAMVEAAHQDSPKGGSEAINQLLPPNAWPRWADRHVWDANGEGWFYGAIVEGGGEGLEWNYELQPSGIAMPPEHDWRVPVFRTKATSAKAQAGDAEVQL